MDRFQIAYACNSKTSCGPFSYPFPTICKPLADFIISPASFYLKHAAHLVETGDSVYKKVHLTNAWLITYSTRIEVRNSR